LLGLTLLAWGGSIGEYSASISMTKKGFGEMAATGCLSGPIFNILVALGVAIFLPLVKSDEPHNASLPWAIVIDG